MSDPRDPFFHAQTHDAVNDLADPNIEYLVIYCGAGATIDRTGLRWRDLIREAFKPDPHAPADEPTPEEIEFLNDQFEAPAFASILSQYEVKNRSQGYRDPAAKARVVRLIQSALYYRRTSNGDPTWHPAMFGRLAGNIARLALIAARRGKSVVLVTTNYDEHLETKVKSWIEAELEVQTREGTGLGKVPFMSLDPANPCDDSSLPKGGEIGLMYLHGHIPLSGNATGDVVLTEYDYAKQRVQTTTRLQELLKLERSGFLTVGASLTDPPLIDSIALTPRQNSSRRYAIVPINSMGMDQVGPKRATRLVRHAQKRGDSLGIKLLVPDFNMQVAQFCQELWQAIGDPSGYHANRYSVRLERWWKGWQTTVKGEDDRLYRVLRKRLDGITDRIRRLGGQSAFTQVQEQFRLELWVRDEAPLPRRLVRYADSTGPNYDHPCDPSSRIRFGSNNAAVRALVEGRPLHIDASDLPGARARWHSYLAVPIWLADEWIPVAALSLASDATKADSVLPLEKQENMESVIMALIHLGRELVDPAALKQSLETPDAASTAPAASLS